MFISLSYLYFGIRHTKETPDKNLIAWVLVNILIAELFFWLGYLYLPFTESFSLLNLIALFITQDIWFFITHTMFHAVPSLYKYHKIHHSGYLPIYAWLAHPVDHIVIHLGSIGVPFIVFPNPFWVLLSVCIIQCWSSVTGHAENSPHHIHHKDVTRRLGSIYLLDRWFGSY